jgi:glycosyltransferase involved in cell wall biosynthesis
MISVDAPGKKSIVFVNRYFHPDHSATSQALTDLARALSARGFAVRVVCSRQLYDDPTAHLPAKETLFGIQVHRVGGTHFGRQRLKGRIIDYATFYFGAAMLLMRLLRRGDVLVVKTDPPLMSLPAVLIAWLKGVVLFTWQQDVFPELATQLGANPLIPWLDGGLRRLRDASLRSSRTNIVISARMRDHFIACGIPAAKLCVIENWADANRIKPKSSDASVLRANLGLADRFVVCYSGNLGRAHEFDTLLAAAESLKRDTRFVFLIIGGGARMPALKCAVAERALENFRFLPYQPRDALEDSLAAADVHLVSLRPALEGLVSPSKLYGILAAGRPLIFVGDCDGEVGRVVGNAACGISVRVGDSSGLVESLQYLRGADEVRLQMGIRARALACEKYTLERATSRWLDVLRSSLQPETPAAATELWADIHTNPAQVTDKL